jgi:hypothetical protein
MIFEEIEISFSSSFEDKKEISFEISKDEEIILLLVRDLLSMIFEEKEISFSSSFGDKKEISFEISKDEEIILLLVRDLLSMIFEEKEISFSSSFEDKKEISFEISKDEDEEEIGTSRTTPRSPPSTRRVHHAADQALVAPHRHVQRGQGAQRLAHDAVVLAQAVPQRAPGLVVLAAPNVVLAHAQQRRRQLRPRLLERRLVPPQRGQQDPVVLSRGPGALGALGAATALRWGIRRLSTTLTSYDGEYVD